jgi:hypothetical protein
MSGSIPSILMVTPCRLEDCDRLQVLMESRLRLGIDIPHLVVCDTEDLDLVKAAVPERSASVVTTADFLPKHIERRRRTHFRRRDFRYWTFGQPIPGWTAQQLVKLSVASTVDAGAVVFIDSDVAFVQHVGPADFVESDGTVKLFESPDENAETVAWAIHAMEFLGVALRNAPVRLYIHNPVVMSTDVAADLVRHISDHQRGHWMDAVMRSASTEYQVYGVFAAHLDTTRRVSGSAPLAAVNFWVPESGDVLQDLYLRVQSVRPKVVGIQSTLGIPPERYRAILERIWTEGGF